MVKTKMDTQITFDIDSEEKTKVSAIAKEYGMSMATFCRTLVVQKAKEMIGENSKQEGYA